MKYNVTNDYENLTEPSEYYESHRDNYVGDYIEADTPEKAVQYAIESLMEQCYRNGDEVDECRRDGDGFTVLSDGKPVERYYDFIAEEV